jgi:hypothetical protein
MIIYEVEGSRIIDSSEDATCLVRDYGMSNSSDNGASRHR